MIHNDELHQRYEKLKKEHEDLRVLGVPREDFEELERKLNLAKDSIELYKCQIDNFESAWKRLISALGLDVAASDSGESGVFEKAIEVIGEKENQLAVKNENIRVKMEYITALQKKIAENEGKVVLTEEGNNEEVCANEIKFWKRKFFDLLGKYTTLVEIYSQPTLAPLNYSYSTGEKP